MRILLASSEVHPFSKTGGLADMVGALAKALAAAGHEVAVVTPLYNGIRAKFPEIERLDWEMTLPLGAENVSGEVWVRRAGERLTTYFIHHAGFFQRDSLYQENGADYPDNAQRFLFFDKAVVHLARYLPLQPEIVHVHDWQTGFVPLFIRHQADQEGWGNAPPVCLTIHNLAYQGAFAAAAYALTNLPRDYFTPTGVEFHGLVNCLKTGIVFADTVTTVSPRYAREITTEEFGNGLDGVLRQRQADLVGILNGVDYEEWNTTHNPFLPHPFNARRLDGKAACKAELQRELSLPANPGVPLFGSITRLTEQKGVDIQLAALEEMLAADLQFVLLGSGAPRFEAGYRRLARRHPGKVAVRIGFDQALSHRIEAGIDFFLMPSQFEPCGLNQMYSQRYGTIPIVRVTGGLDDTVVDVTEDPDRATGIKFTEYSSRALAKAIRKALALYAVPTLMGHYRQNGLLTDFSWERTETAYAAIYRRTQASRVQ